MSFNCYKKFFANATVQMNDNVHCNCHRALHIELTQIKWILLM